MWSVPSIPLWRRHGSEKLQVGCLKVIVPVCQGAVVISFGCVKTVHEELMKICRLGEWRMNVRRVEQAIAAPAFESPS